MYLDELKETGEKLYDVATNPEITPRELQDALFAASRTLGRLQEMRTFLDDLERLEAHAHTEQIELREICASYERFLIFFITEQKLLIHQGLPLDLVLALQTQAETLLEAMCNHRVTKQGVLNAVAELEARLHEAASIADLREIDHQVALRGLQGLTGLSMMKINLEFLPLEITVPGGSVLASGSMGVWLLTNCMGENPMIERLTRFLRRRR
jgi:hypothetical protein